MFRSRSASAAISRRPSRKGARFGWRYGRVRRARASARDPRADRDRCVDGLDRPGREPPPRARALCRLRHDPGRGHSRVDRAGSGCARIIGPRRPACRSDRRPGGRSGEASRDIRCIRAVEHIVLSGELHAQGSCSRVPPNTPRSIRTPRRSRGSTSDRAGQPPPPLTATPPRVIILRGSLHVT